MMASHVGKMMGTKLRHEILLKLKKFLQKKTAESTKIY